MESPLERMYNKLGTLQKQCHKNHLWFMLLAGNLTVEVTLYLNIFKTKLAPLISSGSNHICNPYLLFS